MSEFVKFNSIKRRCNEEVIITEKIDGTNACIIVENGKIVGVQSRSRIITIDDDNAGFAKFAYDNEDKLLQFLEDGYHYGEWAGVGIQKNTQELEGKKLFLFDYWRYDRSKFFEEITCIDVLYTGKLKEDTLKNVMHDLKERKPKAEGVIITSKTWGYKSKETFEYSKGKWSNK